MGQYLKGNNMAPIKINNGGYYAHMCKILMLVISV